MNWKEQLGHTRELLRGFQYIDPRYYGIDITALPLDRVESDIYRGVDPQTQIPVCLKVYNNSHENTPMKPSDDRYMTIENIRTYQRITECAAQVVNNNGWTVSIPEISQKTYTLHIEPITRVGMIAGTAYPCIIMNFIEGPQFGDQWPQIGSKSRLNEPHPIGFFLAEKLRSRTDIPVHYIVFMNMKRDDIHCRITITDLFGSLRTLKNISSSKLQKIQQKSKK